jgi:hypothetical protein
MLWPIQKYYVDTSPTMEYERPRETCQGIQLFQPRFEASTSGIQHFHLRLTTMRITEYRHKYFTLYATYSFIIIRDVVRLNCSNVFSIYTL